LLEVSESPPHKVRYNLGIEKSDYSFAAISPQGRKFNLLLIGLCERLGSTESLLTE